MKRKRTTAPKPLPAGAVMPQVDVAFEMSAAEGTKARPKVKIEAYSGDAVPWWGGVGLVIDTAKLTATPQIPLYLNHDANQLLGQGAADISKGRVTVEGTITGDTGAAETVLEHHKNGFVWRASIGVVFIDRPKFVDEGDTVDVNGKTFDGPIYVTQRARLGETSLCPAGADPTAVADIAASAAQEYGIMTFDEWLKQKKIDGSKLTAAQRTARLAEFNAENGDDLPPEPAPDPAPAEDPAARLRATSAAEADRIAAVTKVTENHLELRAQAIREGWSADKAELAVLRASRPTGVGAPAGFSRDERVNLQVLEAAVRLGSQEPSASVERAYKPEVLEVAHKHRRIGLKALIQLCCGLEGRPVPLLSADVGEWVRCGFSTASLPAILGNSANKLLLAGFGSVKQNAMIVAKRLSANDFKTHTGARLATGGTMEKVAGNGEIKKATLQETSFTYAVDTYAKLIGLTRQQWINDDLGAFTEIPLRFGYDAARTIEKIFWAMVEAAVGTFFATANANVSTGAGSVLGIAGLDAAVPLMLKQKDSDKNPIAAEPRYLVVPPELSAEGDRIYKSDVMIATGVGASAKTAASANTYRGRYEPLTVPQLTSATAWYLIADAMQCPAFGLAFLNGMDAPTVEETDPAPEYLGRVFRGFIDFGVCTIDHQGAVRSAGA